MLLGLRRPAFTWAESTQSERQRNTSEGHSLYFTATVISGPISLIYVVLSALRQFLDLCIARARRCLLFNRGLVKCCQFLILSTEEQHCFSYPGFYPVYFLLHLYGSMQWRSDSFSSADPQSLLTQIQSCEFLSSELVVSFFPTSSVWKSQPYRGLATSLAQVSV